MAEQSNSGSNFSSFQCPSFWISNPKAWFLALEPQFQLRGIKSSETKYYIVTAALPQQIVEEVMDILASPPQDLPYEALKEAILNRTGSSEKERLRRVLQDLSLGDRKPSQLLRLMRQEIGELPVDDKFIRELWLQKLPSDVQFLLAPSQELALDQVALMADNAMQYRLTPVTAGVHTPGPSPKEDGALASIMAKLEKLELKLHRLERERSRSRDRPRSQSRNRSISSSRPKGSECWYHYRHKEKARKCEPPCSWSSNTAAGNAKANV